MSIVISNMTLSRWLVIAAIVMAPLSAVADVAIVKGGPSGDARAMADAALADAGRAMVVCWRSPLSGPIKVAIVVGKDGTVDGKAVTKGRAAQCAAGIVAVWTMPGGPWKAELEITAGAAASPDLATTIQQQLLRESGSIKACQDHAPSASGNAAIKLRIATTGVIDEVNVVSKLGAELDQCVATSVRAIKLKPTGAVGPVNYQLNVVFAGSAAAPIGSATTPATGGTVSGQLTIEQVSVGVKAAKTAISKCIGAGKVAGKHAVVRFTIRPDGTAKNVVIKESSGDSKVDGCVQDAFAKATFATSSDETKVSLPLGF